MNPTAYDRETRLVLVPFLVGLSAYSLFGGYIYMMLGKAEAHLWFTNWYHPLADDFFKYFTETANGIMPVIAIHILVFVRYSWALAMGMAAGTMGVVVQWLKRGVFDLPRPAGFFEEGMLRMIEGVNHAQSHAFPSGHSATAFCMFLLLALIIRKPWATYLLVGWALLAAYSRVYISQHFVEDTIVGAWIGILTAFVAYHYIVRWADLHPQSKLNGKLWPKPLPEL